MESREQFHVSDRSEVTRTSTDYATDRLEDMDIRSKRFPLQQIEFSPSGDRKLADYASPLRPANQSVRSLYALYFYLA